MVFHIFAFPQAFFVVSFHIQPQMKEALPLNSLNSYFETTPSAFFRQFYGENASGLELPVHRRGIGLVCGLADLCDLDLQRALAEGDLDHIADFDLIAGLDLPSVDADAFSVSAVTSTRSVRWP